MDYQENKTYIEKLDNRWSAIGNGVPFKTFKRQGNAINYALDILIKKNPEIEGQTYKDYGIIIKEFPTLNDFVEQLN